MAEAQEVAAAAAAAAAANQQLDDLDPRVHALVALYVRAEARLSLIVRRALFAGRLGEARFRRAQQREAQQVIERLQQLAAPRARELVEQSFRAGGRIGGRTRLFDDQSTYGRINREAVDLLAENLAGRLQDAHRTVGRRVDDVLRREGLRIAAEQLVAEQPVPRATRELRDRLAREGVTSFVDRAGRRWRLETYARMVVNTTKQEAVSEGTRLAMLSRGLDLVTVAGHRCRHHPKDPRHPCVAWEGETFSLTGRSSEHPRLDRLPPFHPNCRHFIVPSVEAAAERRAFEDREQRRAA